MTVHVTQPQTVEGVVRRDESTRHARVEAQLEPRTVAAGRFQTVGGQIRRAMTVAGHCSRAADETERQHVDGRPHRSYVIAIRSIFEHNRHV